MKNLQMVTLHKKYTSRELAETLGLSPRYFNNKRKEILSNFIYEEVKDDRDKRKTYIVIKEIAKNRSPFLKVCDSIAGIKVEFPNESKAEMLLQLLCTKNLSACTLADLSDLLGGAITRQTISNYIKLFREYNILPKDNEEEKRRDKKFIVNDDGEIVLEYVPMTSQYYFILKNYDTGLSEFISKKEWAMMVNQQEKWRAEYIDSSIKKIANLNKTEDEKDELLSKVQAQSYVYAKSCCKRYYKGIPSCRLSIYPTNEAIGPLITYFKSKDLNKAV